MSYPTARNATPRKFLQNQGQNANIYQPNESNPILKKSIQRHNNSNQNQINSRFEKWEFVCTWIKIWVLAEGEGPAISTTLPRRRGTLWRGGRSINDRSAETLDSISLALSSVQIQPLAAIFSLCFSLPFAQLPKPLLQRLLSEGVSHGHTGPLKNCDGPDRPM